MIAPQRMPLCPVGDYMYHRVVMLIRSNSSIKVQPNLLQRERLSMYICCRFLRTMQWTFNGPSYPPSAGDLHPLSAPTPGRFSSHLPDAASTSSVAGSCSEAC